MRIAIAQLDPVIGDLAGNAARIEAAIERAEGAGAQLLLTPELALTGYPPRDLLERPGFVREAGRALERIAGRARALTVLVGTIEPNPDAEGRALWNAAAILERGKVSGFVRKQLLPTYDVFDEDRYFEPGGHQAPLVVAGVSLGITICEDMWSADPTPGARALYRAHDPIKDQVARGARVLVNLSASPFHRGKIGLREELIRSHVLAHGRPFIFVNQVGGQDELVFDGSSCVLDANGRVKARAHSFAEDFLVVEIDSATGNVEGPRHPVPGSETAEVWDALVLGTRDYARKCGFERALLGVSGGIDSALTAAIATEALGKENVLGVSMPSRYSSPGSKDDAKALCENLGIGLLTVPIEPMFRAFLETLAPAFAGRPQDVTEENIQARVRGTILMALSNKRCDLLLTTGNKSELATGYCTLYGDMAGGLAVIADCPKLLVYELARHANRKGEKIPRASIEKPPSAELRPDQKDTDTLPPFEVLDPILELLVERKLDAAEIVARGFEPAVVTRVARMVDVAEYKRKQMPPGLKVTSKAFGVGRRYPIAKRVTSVV
ncbi:MAG TPA: NAD+ synthase [Planctomycetota bacterium]|nr:NAD+ synthase [Planctomycetota bacterium]